MNYNNFEQETSRMLELMKYGMNEGTFKTSAPRVEYSVKAADGLTYGIVNEGTKYYIKVAPKKDTKIVNEDFDYIGGEMNKKYNEYKSYSAASKNLDLKIMQINEAYSKEKRVIVEASKKPVEADWQVNETVEMRKEINRMNEISRNVGFILTEGAIPSEHTLPEAPAKNPSQKKVNAPFTDTATAKGDKDFNETETNYARPSGSPYSTSTNAKMTSDKAPKLSGNNGNAYTEDAEYAPDNTVTDQKPSGGKVTRADENRKRRVKLTEEQVLAWCDCDPDFMDKSKGTKIGSTAPFSDKVSCKTSNQCPDNVDEAEGPIHNCDKTLMNNPGTGKVAHGGDPFNQKKYSSAEADNGVIAEGDFEDAAGFEGYADNDNSYADDSDYDDEDFDMGDDIDDDEYDDMWADTHHKVNDIDTSIYDDDDEDGLIDDDDDILYEMEEEELPFPEVSEGRYSADCPYTIVNGRIPRNQNNGGWSFDPDDALGDEIYDEEPYEDPEEDLEEGTLFEVELHDFGKHPAYRKRPMTLPPNKEVAPNGAREWDDESAQGEEPFGKRIGSSAPFEKTVQVLTDSIMESLGF